MDRTFNFFGAIEVTLHKQILINLTSIMEALIVEAGIKSGKRKSRSPVPAKVTAAELVKIGVLGEEPYKAFYDFYYYRNRIHLHVSRQNEILAAEFNRTLTETCQPALENLIASLASGLKTYKKEKTDPVLNKEGETSKDEKTAD